MSFWESTQFGIIQRIHQIPRVGIIFPNASWSSSYTKWGAFRQNIKFISNSKLFFFSLFFFLILWNTRCEKKEHATSFNDDDFAYLHKKHHYQRHSLCEKCDHENVTDLHANINLSMPTMFIYCMVWCAFSYWMHSMNFEQQILLLKRLHKC